MRPLPGAVDLVRGWGLLAETGDAAVDSVEFLAQQFQFGSNPVTLGAYLGLLVLYLRLARSVLLLDPRRPPPATPTPPTPLSPYARSITRFHPARRRYTHTKVCDMIICIQVDRFSVTMEPDFGAAVRDAAERAG